MRTRKNITVSTATKTELQVLLSRGYGKDASHSIELAVHAAFVATAETKTKRLR